MANKELRQLNRRELLEMLLVQCQEMDRLQEKSEEVNARFEDIKQRLDEMTESYEGLKKKLDLKDERLNEKDAKIGELRQEIKDLEHLRAAERAEIGKITESILRLSGSFEDTRRAAEQYLLKSGRPRESKEGNKTVSVIFGREQRDGNPDRNLTVEKKRERDSFTAIPATGERYG